MSKCKSPVAVVEKSFNGKLSVNGKASATYVSQHTCPKACPLRGKGCYAEYGKTGIVINRLKASKEYRPSMIAKAEAKGILALSATKPLRLHVVGDAFNGRCSAILAEAAEIYTAKHGMPVWTYTRNHVTPRSDWGSISVLRSCTSLRQAETANKAGYASALIVKEFKSDKKYYIGRGMYGIPCPVQTGRVKSCVDCKICMLDSKLQERNLVVLLKVHGNGHRQVSEMLDNIKK